MGWRNETLKALDSSPSNEGLKVNHAIHYGIKRN
jgi:hypothetical protein